MFLLDLFRKQAKGHTPYEWFEQIILGILVFIISIIILYALILVGITLVDDFRVGIAIMVVARKIVLLDYAAASVETLLGFGGLALALGGLYWLISDGEQRRRGSGSG